MPHDIRPLTRYDLPELSRFLTEGFQASFDSAFAAVDVLAWKYLDPRGPEAGEGPRSLIARDLDTGKILGHLGLCPGRWHGGVLPAGGVSTLHMIDWLGSKEAVGVGAALMRRAHESTETQYGLGGSVAGRGVGGRGGYSLIRRVPVFSRALRPLYRLRDPSIGLPGRLLRATRDTLGRLRSRSRRPQTPVTLVRLTSFDDRVTETVQAYRDRALYTTRDPALFDHLLRFPRGGLTGWELRSGGRSIGFALLSVIPQSNGLRLGRIVDCVLTEERDTAWHGAISALSDELYRQGADLAHGVASTPWFEQALVAAGYAETHRLDFRLRDRSKLIPTEFPVHLTLLEADYAYL